MQILLCAATDFEIAETIAFLKDQPEFSIDILITGIGLTASTYTMTKAICTKRPDLMIQAGIAGALDPRLPLSSVWVVEREYIGDMGVEEKEQFLTPFDMNFLQDNTAPWQNRSLKNDLENLHDLHLGVTNGITVNEITTRADRIRYYKEMGASLESMEGAALHYVGLMEQVPFLQVRSLSNYVGERNKTNWKLRESISTLNHELQNLIKKLFV